MARDKTYLEAIQIIEVARRERAKKLDLSNPSNRLETVKLTELPVELRQLTELESLDLSNNLLRKLPEWLGQLTQ